MDPPFDHKTEALYQETVRAFLTQIKAAVERSGDIADEAFPEYLNLAERLSGAYNTFLSAHSYYDDDADDEDEEGPGPRYD